MKSTVKRWIPHNYQCYALSFAIDRTGAALFLDPGLGKTSISLAIIKTLINSGKIRSFLLIAPLRVVYSVWPSEILKWLNFNGITYEILHNDNKSSLWNSSKNVYLINPEGLKWLHTELLSGLKKGKQCPFNGLIVDESTKFKNHSSDRFEYVKNMLPLFIRRYILTGTPSPKSLLDLWSQIYIIDEGKSLGENFYHFRKKYFYTEDWNKYDWKLKDFCEEEIHKAIRHLAIDMKAEDYLDMPELIFNDIKVQLPKKAIDLYKKMERDMFIEMDSIQASAEAAAQMTIKCHQMANGIVYEDIPEDLSEEEIRAYRKIRKSIHVHDVKIEALKDLIDELNGKPLLVGYHFKNDLISLKKALGKNVPYIGSGVSQSESKRIENSWNRGEISVLLGDPSSMGHGLNLQGAGNDVCFYSITSDVEAYIQFYRRVYRQGVSGRYVRVHHLIAENTVDEAFMMRLKERADQQMDLRIAIREYRKRSPK